MIDTNDVDPIAEAEVYMAYGRDAQAEEILKDAIAKEPKRYELHLKLLEIFAARKDTGAFETLAGELYAALGATDPTWTKVAEMGRRLEPSNPLYGDAGTHVTEAKPEPVDFDATMIQAHLILAWVARIPHWISRWMSLLHRLKPSLSLKTPMRWTSI
jgi:Tfp pilus assembly protein FimV